MTRINLALALAAAMLFGHAALYVALAAFGVDCAARAVVSVGIGCIAAVTVQYLSRASRRAARHTAAAAFSEG